MEDLIEGLQRARNVVIHLTTTINRCVQHLDTMMAQEHGGKIDTIDTIIEGSQETIVYIPSDSSGMDRLKQTVKLLSTTKERPTIIMGKTMEKDPLQAIKVARCVAAQVKSRKKTRLVIVLTWSRFLPSLENEDIVICGKRYFHDPKNFMPILEKKLRERGIMIKYDEHQYGGGSVVFNLCQEFGSTDITVCELTLSERFAENQEGVASLVEALNV